VDEGAFSGGDRIALVFWGDKEIDTGDTRSKPSRRTQSATRSTVSCQLSRRVVCCRVCLFPAQKKNARTSYPITWNNPVHRLNIPESLSEDGGPCAHPTRLIKFSVCVCVSTAQEDSYLAVIGDYLLKRDPCGFRSLTRSLPGVADIYSPLETERARTGPRRLAIGTSFLRSIPTQSFKLPYPVKLTQKRTISANADPPTSSHQEIGVFSPTAHFFSVSVALGSRKAILISTTSVIISPVQDDAPTRGTHGPPTPPER